jgi:hypothetical protein
LFFQSQLPNSEIYLSADKIIDKCQANNFCRFVARLIPVENITGTDSAMLMKDLERLIHYHFVDNWKDDKAPTYALEFKVRNNESIKQKDILHVLDEVVR